MNFESGIPKLWRGSFHLAYSLVKDQNNNEDNKMNIKLLIEVRSWQNEIHFILFEVSACFSSYFDRCISSSKESTHPNWIGIL